MCQNSKTWIDVIVFRMCVDWIREIESDAMQLNLLDSRNRIFEKMPFGLIFHATYTKSESFSHSKIKHLSQQTFKAILFVYCESYFSWLPLTTLKSVYQIRLFAAHEYTLHRRMSNTSKWYVCVHCGVNIKYYGSINIPKLLEIWRIFFI